MLLKQHVRNFLCNKLKLHNSKFQREDENNNQQLYNLKVDPNEKVNMVGKSICSDFHKNFINILIINQYFPFSY